MVEVAEANQIIQDAISEDATFIYGQVTDDRIQGDIQITVIATGFELKNTDEKSFGDKIGFPVGGGIVDPLSGILSGQNPATMTPSSNVPTHTMGSAPLSSDRQAREKAIDILDLPPFFQK